MKKAGIGIWILLLVFVFQGKVHSGKEFNNNEKISTADIKEDYKKSELLQLTSGSHVLGFGSEGVYIAAGTHMLHIGFREHNSVRPATADENNAESGRSVPLQQVYYKNLWDGVDAEFAQTDGGLLKSTYYVQPTRESGKSIDQIRLKYNVPVKVNEHGELVLSYENGQFLESKPVAWQFIDGEKIFVNACFNQIDEKEIGFVVEDYDAGIGLIIDPVLQWNTFIGGTGWDHGQGIAVDGSGSVYVTGYSGTSWGSPVRAHSGGQYDAYVAKLNFGGQLMWNTFLGGAHWDEGCSIVIDDSNYAYVTGHSASTWGSPVRAHTGGYDVFVVKLHMFGSVLWNTFLGGTSNDFGRGIDIDGSGNLYIAGRSSAAWGSPVRAFSGDADAFASKLNSSGVLQWHTFLGGTGSDYGKGTAVDSSGNVYVAGYSNETWGSPVRAYSDMNDAYAAKLNSSGELQWNTFLGGSHQDYGYGIAVDSSGNVYVSGYNYNVEWGNPVRSHSGGNDAFAAKLNSSGTLQWNTFLGCSNADFGYGIAADAEGNTFVTGYSWWTWGSPLRSHYYSDYDAFTAMLNSSGVMQWNAFLGGSGRDEGFAVAVDDSGIVYVTGKNNASWGSPVRAYSDEWDAFAAKLTVYQISGTVNESGTELPGVTMSGLPSAPVTAGDGSYTESVVANWHGTVIPVLSGYNFTPPSRDYSPVTTNQVNQDYTAELITYQISGTVTEGGAGLSGVSINGLPSVPTTIGDGTYSDTVGYGWSGTAVPALAGYAFSPPDIEYTNVTADQSGQDYTAAINTYTIEGTITEEGSGCPGVTLNGLPTSPSTLGDGTYSDTVSYGWAGTVTPLLSGYSFEPESRNYSNVIADHSGQDYAAYIVYYSSPSDYQVIPEVLWAPASGGGTWMTEVQITDVTGGSEVSVYYNTAAGDRRGPIALWTGPGPDTSVKTGNLLNTLDLLDPGYSFYGTVGAVEFMTQDSGHKIHIIAKTKNGNYSKTFPGLNHNNDNTADGSRIMMIQNLASNDAYRTAYGGFNPTDESITVEYELLDADGNTIGTTFTETFTGHQYQAVNLFSEAGVPYPSYSYENIWLKITPVSGSGELMSYGATADNTTSDPAVHIAAQAQLIGGYNSPSNYQVIPEVLWAPASGGGTWMTEVQITDITGGSEVSVYFNTSSGERRGPITLFTGSSPGSSGRTPNLLATLDALDSGYDYYAKVGAVEFVTQDGSHNIQVMARTSNGDYSKSFQGLNLNDANTAADGRTLMVQNLINDDSHRTAFGGFNPTDDDVTVEFTLINGDGSTIGTSFTKTFSGRRYQAFNPFTESGVPYPGNSFNNVWIKVEVTSGSGQLMVYGATANNVTSDPAVHRAVQHY